MATIIDPASAQSLIQEYQQQNAAPEGPANKTHEGHHLKGFFLDRASLEHLLSNPNAAGVSLYLAKHPDHVGSPENRLTLLYSGAEANTAEGGDAPTYITTGPMYGDTPPCPTYC